MMHLFRGPRRQEELRLGGTLLLLLLLLACFCQRFAVAQPYRGRFSDAKCTDTQTGRELFIGDAYTRPGQCVRVQCLGNLQLWEDSCHEPKLQGNCQAMPAPNEYLDYPSCCRMYECRTYDRDESGGETQETRTYDHYGTLRKTHITQMFVISDPLEGKVAGNGLKTQFEI